MCDYSKLHVVTRKPKEARNHAGYGLAVITTRQKGEEKPEEELILKVKK